MPYLDDAAAFEHRLQSLTRELTAVYKFAPNTSPSAYKQAKADLDGGHFTFSDEDIDALLPTHLCDKKPPPITL